MASIQPDIEGVERLLADVSLSSTEQDTPLESATSELNAIPPHLSHDPTTNTKRSDPFQFGSRMLGQEANVYEFNAWDNVHADDTHLEYAESQYAKQRESPVSDFDKSTLLAFTFSSPHAS